MTDEAHILQLVTRILSVVEEHGPRLKALEINFTNLAELDKQRNGRLGKVEERLHEQKAASDVEAGVRKRIEQEKRLGKAIIANITHPAVYIAIGAVATLAGSAGLERLLP